MDLRFSRRSVLAMAGVAFIAPGLVRAGEPVSLLPLPTADGRISEISIWRTSRRRAGTILFSHGALSAPAKYEALISRWVAAGFDVFAPLHVDSTDHPDTAKYKGLTSWAARIEDMRALAKHIGKRSYIAAGHSYGGLVALTLGGASAVIPEGVKGPLRDRHAKAVVAFSPPGASPGLVDESGFATLAVPALIQTGDRDVPPGSSAPDGWKQHLLAYDAAKAGGNRYALVLDGVDHYFGGLICRPELPGPKQIQQLDIAAEISTAFLKGYGAGDGKAKKSLVARLNPQGPARLTRK